MAEKGYPARAGAAAQGLLHAGIAGGGREGRQQSEERPHGLECTGEGWRSLRAAGGAAQGARLAGPDAGAERLAWGAAAPRRPATRRPERGCL